MPVMNVCIRVASILLATILCNSSFANNVDGLVLGPEIFERGKGKPRTETRQFTHVSDSEIIILIYNGGPPEGSDSENAPVTSATIKVAGQTVFSQHDFKQDVELLESRVAVGQGDHELEVQINGKPGTRFVVEILSAPPLVTPSDAVRASAGDLLRQLPGAQIDFGQRTGQIISVRSPGLGQLPTNSPAVPLSDSRGTGDAEIASALMEFFDRFGYLWGVDDPEDELFIGLRSNRQYDNIGTIDPSNKLSLANLPTHELELVNMHQGIRVLGHYAHGLFDEAGNLQALTTNIEPILKGLDPKPQIPEQVLLGILFNEIEKIVETFPTLWWLNDMNQPLETGSELVWLPPQKGTDGLLRLAWDLRVRNNMLQARFWIDAKTGEILRSIDASPSDWFDDGAVAVQNALDEANNMRSFPTTRFDDRWYMGYGRPYTGGNAPYFIRASRVQVGDNTNATDRGNMRSDVVSISALGGNRWETDSRFTGNFRAAVSMADNATKALDWWAQFGWRSWDGRGSTLWTVVNGNRTEDGRAQFNAFGINGAIMTTDATRGGYTTAGGLETIGHEFMHSVVDATTNLAYFGESGAINEALADLFGVALTGIGDRLNNDLYGESDFGGTSGPRNFVNPSLRGQPDHFGSYRYTRADSGGVHANSGILNKAHASMIIGRPFVPSSALGLAQTTEIVRAANQHRLFSPNAGMDEFAAAVRGYCRFIRVFAGAFGRDWPVSHCNAIDWAYSAVGIAPFNIDEFTGQDDAMIRSATWLKARPSENKKAVWIELRNKNTTGTINSLDIQNAFLIDEFGDLITLPLGSGSVFSNVPCGDDIGRFGSLEPGESGCLIGKIDASGVPGYMTGPINFDVEVILRNGDGYPADNTFPATISPDYEIARTSIRNRGPTRASFSARVLHALGGFPAGLQARYLARSGNSGSLSAFGAVSERSRDTDPDCTDLSSSSCAFVLDFLDLTFDLLQTELAVPLIVVPSASLIPGSDRRQQVWADNQLRLPTTSPGRQFFALMDSNDIADEGDETNNLWCVNCVPSADVEFPAGMLVRVPEGVDVDSMFPITVRDAARKLPAAFPRLYEVREIVIPDLGHPVVPDIPGPF